MKLHSGKKPQRILLEMCLNDFTCDCNTMLCRVYPFTRMELLGADVHQIVEGPTEHRLGDVGNRPHGGVIDPPPWRVELYDDLIPLASIFSPDESIRKDRLSIGQTGGVNN